MYDILGWVNHVLGGVYQLLGGKPIPTILSAFGLASILRGIYNFMFVFYDWVTGWRFARPSLMPGAVSYAMSTDGKNRYMFYLRFANRRLTGWTRHHYTREEAVDCQVKCTFTHEGKFYTNAVYWDTGDEIGETLKPDSHYHKFAIASVEMVIEEGKRPMFFSKAQTFQRIVLFRNGKYLLRQRL